MKFSTLALAGTAAAAHLSSRTDTSKLPKLTSENRMQTLRQLKLSQRDASRAAGMFDEGRWTSTNAATACVDGKAGEYSCSNVDLAAHLTHEDMGSTDREGNDIWGWTDPDSGREFAIVGQTDQTAFVEVLEGGSLAYIGRLPTQTQSSVWRDMKVIGNHAYIGSEAGSHGIQVFDLTKLLDLDPSSPKDFNTDSDLTAHFTGVGSSHNVVANVDSQHLYVVGARECSGGLVMVDVSDPSNPSQVGCDGTDGYVHDAQCVNYAGVDTRYSGSEICFGYNEDTFTIYDVTDKASPRVISTTPYEGSAYTHQGWTVGGADMRYVMLDDELDEMYGSEKRTMTYLWDISDLEKPVWTGTYLSPVASIDHNQYVVDGLSYQANYGSGLRVVDVSSIGEDPSGGAMTQAGFFDCYPEDDNDPQAEFYGAWSSYPYFASGTIVLNCIERGLFALKYTG